MELERDFQLLKSDVLFQKLYERMTEQQMLRLQEKYVASGRNMKDRYAAISKSIFEQQFQQIDDCRREMDNMTKLLNDTAALAMLTQYCSDIGVVNWEDFNKTLNKTVTDKSREVGATAAHNVGFAAGAAAAGAAAGDPNDVDFAFAAPP